MNKNISRRAAWFAAAALMAGAAISPASATEWNASVGTQTADQGIQVLAFLPNEFWINFELANCLPDAQWAEQIAFYRVAVALRPDSAKWPHLTTLV